MGTLIRAVAIFVLAATMASAQVRENVTVELIEVPVYVLAADGQPVRGLTREAFELRVNRRVQPIEYFDAIDFAAPSAQAEKQRPQRERRLYLLLFDQLFSIPGKLVRAQRAAAYAVAQSDPGTDLFAVATYTAGKGVQFATPFLSDRVAVRRAIDTLSISRAGDPLSLAISPSERADWIAMAQQTDSDSSAASKDDLAGPELADMLRGGAANQEMQAQPKQSIIQDLLENFADLAARLSALEGQKHVLYFSEGFQSSLMHGGNSPVPSGSASGGGVDARSMRILDEMFRHFRAAGIFLDSVDIAGVRHGQGKFQLYENDSLQFMAHGTGGEFVHNRNDLGHAVTDLARAQQVVYVLAFHRRDLREGKIDVRVHGVPSGTRVSFRQGFGAAGRAKDVDPLQLADILINDLPQTGLDLRLDVSPSMVTVEVPRAEGSVDVILYIFDAQGSVVVARDKRLTSAGPMLVRAAIDLPPGRYVAKALARVGGTTSLGFARRDFTVPGGTP